MVCTCLLRFCFSLWPTLQSVPCSCKTLGDAQRLAVTLGICDIDFCPSRPMSRESHGSPFTSPFILLWSSFNDFFFLIGGKSTCFWEFQHWKQKNRYPGLNIIFLKCCVSVHLIIYDMLFIYIFGYLESLSSFVDVLLVNYPSSLCGPLVRPSIKACRCPQAKGQPHELG